jgi:hypothetical protein
MKDIKLSLILYLFLFLLGCGYSNSSSSTINHQNQIEKKENGVICQHSIINDTLRQEILNLDYTIFDTVLIKQIFNNPPFFNFKKLNNIDNSFICIVKSGDSELHFSGNNFKERFYLDF